MRISVFTLLNQTYLKLTQFSIVSTANNGKVGGTNTTFHSRFFFKQQSSKYNMKSINLPLN